MENKLDNKIILEFTGTFSELKKYSFYVLRKKILYGFIGMFIFYTLLDMGLSQRMCTSKDLLRSLIVSIFLVSVFCISMYIRIWKAYFKDPLLKLKKTYTLSNHGINITTSQSEMAVSWEEIIKIKELNDMFIFYVTSCIGIMLPKKYFKSQDEINLFKALIQKEAKTKNIKLLK